VLRAEHRQPILLSILALVFAACGDEASSGEEQVDPLVEALGWSPYEPQVPIGTVVSTDIVCGFLEGVGSITWTFDGERWPQTTMNLQPLLELAPCFIAFGPGFLEWNGDGSMYVEAGGLEHYLDPTDLENRWGGTAIPIGGASRDCLDALEQLDVEYPVPLTATIVGIEEPK